VSLYSGFFHPVFQQTLLKKGGYPDTHLLELLCSVQHFCRENWLLISEAIVG
jgi:hypothetical protein